MSRLEKEGLEEGRKGLIRQLADYRKSMGYIITVVFDGWIGGSLYEEHVREKGVHVIYSKRGEKADEVIKRLAQKKGKQIVVITSDRDIAETVARCGGITLDSIDFETKISPYRLQSFTKSSFCDKQDDHIVKNTTKKKGPSHRLSKRARQAEKVLKKL